MANPRLETDRLILRAHVLEDWERIHTYASDPDFSRYEAWGPNSIEDTQKFVAEKVVQSRSATRFAFEFAVCLKESDLLIGGCGIRRETELSRVANLGWAISPEFQNQGFATEAARALVTFGFDELNLAVIFATCDTRNAASYRVMEKLGMARVGTTMGNQLVKGYARDSFRYELTR